jgi:hypothetical protein
LVITIKYARKLPLMDMGHHLRLIAGYTCPRRRVHDLFSSSFSFIRRGNDLFATVRFYEEGM